MPAPSIDPAVIAVDAVGKENVTGVGMPGPYSSDSSITDARGMAEKLGIHPITLKSGPQKAAPNPLEKFTPDQERVLQAVIKDFFNWFVDIVAERRHMPREQVLELNIPTGIPLVYTFDDAGKIEQKKYLFARDDEKKV